VPDGAHPPPFLRRGGLLLLLRTGNNGRETIGRYGYCTRVVRELQKSELAAAG
jgi:hypothetical protein